MLLHTFVYLPVLELVLLYVGDDILQFYIYLQYSRSIPYEIGESAMLEGVSLLRIFYAFIFPLLVPARATIFILKILAGVTQEAVK